jgi:hypothetical protein
LRTGDPVPPIDDEERHSGRAERPGGRLVLPIEARLTRDVDQGRAVEQGPLFGEVGPVQPLDEVGLDATGLGEMQQPMRVAGVAAAQPGHPELKSVQGRSLLHLSVRVLRLSHRHPGPGGEHLHRRRGQFRHRVARSYDPHEPGE